MHIAIAGNIGSGKSTLTGLLAKHYSWEAHYEDVEEINVCDSIKEASSKYLLGNDAVYTFVGDIIEKVEDKD